MPEKETSSCFLRGVFVCVCKLIMYMAEQKHLFIYLCIFYISIFIFLFTEMSKFVQRTVSASIFNYVSHTDTNVSPHGHLHSHLHTHTHAHVNTVTKTVFTHSLCLKQYLISKNLTSLRSIFACAHSGLCKESPATCCF